MAILHLTLILLFIQQFVALPLGDRGLIQEISKEDLNRLRSWTPNDTQRMWEVSGQYEGDIILTAEQMNGIIFNTYRYRWPNREVPYEIDVAFSQKEKNLIEKALELNYGKTCVQIRPKTPNDKDYVYVTREPKGCFSHVGRQRGRQQLNLDPDGCLYHATIAHEFLHAVGFFHQQSATDRDDYVEIKWENIMRGTEHNFNKYEDNAVSSFDEKYDYGSLMHYGMYAFTSNSKPTIVPKDPNAVIGEAESLSTIDIAKMEKMYGCR